MDEQIQFVKSQIAHHAKTAAWHGKNGRAEKQARHQSLHNKFVSFLATIKEINENGGPQSTIVDGDNNDVGNRLGDLSDVPEHIRKQLVSVQIDEFEAKIIAVMKDEYRGAASIDEIMVGLWRKYKIQDKNREFLARKIYRMVRSNSVFSVPKKKGVYSLAAPEKIGIAKKPDNKPVNLKDYIGEKSAQSAEQ